MRQVVTLQNESPSDAPVAPLEKPWVMVIGKDNHQGCLLLQALENVLAVKCAWRPDAEVNTLLHSHEDAPELVLWDCLERDPNAIERLLGKTNGSAEQLVPIAFFNVSQECHLEPVVNRLKGRGIFYRNDDFEFFMRGVRAILNGELWLPRKILSKCIDMSQSAQNTDQTNVPQLSRREKEILRCVCAGLSNKQIAEDLDISSHTVKTHLYKIYQKLEVPNRLQAMLWAAAYLSDSA